MKKNKIDHLKLVNAHYVGTRLCHNGGTCYLLEHTGVL